MLTLVIEWCHKLFLLLCLLSCVRNVRKLLVPRTFLLTYRLPVLALPVGKFRSSCTGGDRLGNVKPLVRHWVLILFVTLGIKVGEEDRGNTSLVEGLLGSAVREA